MSYYNNPFDALISDSEDDASISHKNIKLVDDPKPDKYKPKIKHKNIFKESASSFECNDGLNIESAEKQRERESNPEYKTILCYNMLHKGSCRYKKLCVYAHTLDEQAIQSHREKAYRILQNNKRLESVELVVDKELLKGLSELTDLCYSCTKKKVCLGGYNCRHGACDNKYQVCRSEQRTD